MMVKKMASLSPSTTTWKTRMAVLAVAGVMMMTGAEAHVHMTFPTARDLGMGYPTYCWPYAVGSPMKPGGSCVNQKEGPITPVSPGPFTIKLEFCDGANHIGPCSAYIYDPQNPGNQVKVATVQDCARSVMAGAGAKGSNIPAVMQIDIPSSGLPCSSHCVLRWELEAHHIGPPYELYDACADISIGGGSGGNSAPSAPPASSSDSSPQVQDPPSSAPVQNPVTPNTPAQNTPSTGAGSAGGNCATVSSGDGCWQTVSKAASSDVANTVCNDPKYAVVQPGQQICWGAAGSSAPAPSASSSGPSVAPQVSTSTYQQAPAPQVPASPAASSPSVDSPAPSTGSGNCATVSSGDGCWQTVSKAASSDVANTVCNDPKYAVVQPGQQICWNAAGAGGSSVAPSADSGASFYNVQAPAAATSSTQSPSQTPPKRTRRRKSKKTKSKASSNTQSTSNAAPYQVASSPASYVATTGFAATSNSQASTTSANNCATVVAGDGCWQTVSKATADTTLANTVCNDPKYTIVQPGQQICW